MANAVPAWIRPTRKMCFDGGFDGPVGRFTCNGVLIKGKAQPEVSTPGAGAASSGLVDERVSFSHYNFGFEHACSAFWTDIDYFRRHGLHPECLFRRPRICLVTQ